MEPTHSPFGLIGQIARDTGWSVNYIMRGVNYPCLMLMWSDVSRYVEPRQKTLLELLQERDRKAEEAVQTARGMSPFDFFNDNENNG